MMESKEIRVAAIVLTLNEGERIVGCLKSLKPNVDYIVVVDGGSTDDTVAKASTYADRVVKRKPYTDWSEERNYSETLLPDDIDWVLHIDADELLHERLLPEIRTVIGGVMERNPDVIAFRFPRANLPKAEHYPDYQVRLLKVGSGYKWSYPIHSVPTLDDVNVDSIPGKCMTMLDLPMWHLPRRTDISRPWWSAEKKEND